MIRCRGDGGQRWGSDLRIQARRGRKTVAASTWACSWCSGSKLEADGLPRDIEFRSDRPCRTAAYGRRMISFHTAATFGGLQGLLRPPHGRRGERLSANRYGSRPMTRVQRIRPAMVHPSTLHSPAADAALSHQRSAFWRCCSSRRRHVSNQIAPESLTLVNIHKPLGILILILALILGLVVRLHATARPPLPPRPAGTHEALPRICRITRSTRSCSRCRSSAGRCCQPPEYPVVIWPGVWLPPILPLDPGLHSLLWNAHFYLAFLFFALILMHLAAGLFHGLIRRDGVFDAMGPRLTHDEVAPAESGARRRGPVRSR